MAYEFTFTPRFQKHFKTLTIQEKNSLKPNLSSWLKILPILPCVPNIFKEPLTFLNVASTWISALFGITKAPK